MVTFWTRPMQVQAERWNDRFWLVTFPDGTQKAYSQDDFEATFTGMGLVEEVEKTHPTFLIVCEKCGSAEVYFTNELGGSPESGSWGSADLVCDHCGNRVELIST